LQSGSSWPDDLNNSPYFFKALPQNTRKGEKIQVPKEPSVSYEQLKQQHQILKHNIDQMALTMLSGAVQLKDYGLKIQMIADQMENFFPPPIRQQLMKILQTSAEEIDQKTGITPTPDNPAQPAPEQPTDYAKAKAEALKKLEEDRQKEASPASEEQPAPA
jgi:hypothetical protein